MTTRPDFDRIATDWLADGPVELSDRVLYAVLEEVHHTRQRRESAPGRFSTMPSLFKLGAVAAALLMVVAVGSMLVDRAASPPVGSSPGPSASASTAPPSLIGSNGELQAGLYQTDLVRPGASFRLDCCFDVVRHDSGILLLAELGLDRHLLLYTPSSVVDPATGSDAPVPADLGRWLADHPGLDVSAPVPLSLGGLDGTAIEGAPRLDADFNADGDLLLMRATAVSRFAIGSDARFRIAVLDAPDGPLVVAVLARADGYDEFSAKADTFLTSLQLGR